MLDMFFLKPEIAQSKHVRFPSIILRLITFRFLKDKALLRFRPDSGSVFPRWLMFMIAFLVLSSGAKALTFTKEPYLQHVTKNSIIICWETDEPFSAVVRYGDTKQLGQFIDIPGRETFHEVTLTGLKAATDYYFMVEAGELKYKGKFRSAPNSGDPFRMVIYGDFRVGPVENTLVKRMIKKKPVVVVTLGDYLSDGQEPTLWPHLFRTILPIAKKFPYYVSLGNHEKDSSMYFKYFAMPGNERWYSFDYGNIHFVALDSNSPYRYNPEQKKWLKEDLKQARKNIQETPFIFVYFHHPPFGTGKRHGDFELAQTWSPIFEKYKVDAVWCGHEHQYERIMVKKVLYIISGGGGAALYDFVYDDAFTVKRAKEYHYMLLDVKKDVVYVKAISLEGRTFDEFEIINRQLKQSDKAISE